MKNILWISVLILYCTSINAQDVVINEVMAKNNNVITDFEENYEDWIELYNDGDADINLEGFFLSDDPEEPEQWIFPDVTINAGDFLLLFASSKDTIVGNEIHTNFKLSADGEPVLLSNTLGELVDSIDAQELAADQSYGRVEDGDDDFDVFVITSPNASNDNNSTKYPIDFSHTAGQYADAFTLTVMAADDLELRYTTDGNVPDENSPLYTDGIIVESREGDPNTISEIPVTADFLAYEVEGEVYKINTIRVQAFLNGQAVSDIHTRSYIIEEEEDRYTLPMVSLVTAPDNFFDDSTGIYVPGANYDGNDENTMNTFQRGSDWERPIHFEYFEEGELILAQDAGVRLHGGASRRDRQKSMRLYARSEYGDSKFRHPFFESKDIDEFKRLLLRGKPTSNNTFMTDELTSRLLDDTDLAHMATKEVVVFLNGEFWGIYNIRERIDKHFIEANYGVDEDDLTLLEDNPSSSGCCIEGDAEEYVAMLDYIADNDMTNSAVYDSVQQLMDVENYMDYLITEFYVANYDWPRNNVRYWKEDGGKWQWLLYDVDFGLRETDRPSITNFFNNEVDNASEWSTELAQNLVQNEDFLNRFTEKFEEQLNNLFTRENIAEHAYEIRDNYAPQMQEYLDRYGYETSYFLISYNRWLENVEKIINDFSVNRPCVLKEQMQTQFNKTMDVFGCYDENDVIDIALTEITNPTSTIEPGYATVDVTLVNNSNVTLNIASVEVTVNGVLQPSYIYASPNLAPGESINVAVVSFLFETSGTYDISVTATQPNGVDDDDTSDNTVTTTVVVEAPPCSANEPIEMCTEALTPVILCPEFCFNEGVGYTITGASSFFTTCSVSFLDGECIRYIPLPNMEMFDIYDDIRVFACNSEGLCDTVVYRMAVGDCNAERQGLQVLEVTTPSVYPNPSNGIFNLLLPVEEGQTQHLQVYDLNGRLVQEHTFEVAHVLPTYALDLRDQPKGVYFVHWQQAKKSKVLKLIVE